MKKLTLTFHFVFLVLLIFAQSPQAFKYQAVVRDNTGEIITSQSVSFRINIHDGSEVGTVIYQETHNLITNQFGLAIMEIGNGAPAVGTFEDIDWGSDSKFMELELDLAGGTNYLSMGTTQMMSVPYSLYSENTANPDDADADPANELQALSIAGSDLSISEGNTVTLPSSPGDNLGNHTATQNIQLAGNWLSNDGGSEGLYITNAGKVGIDYQNPTSKLTIVDNDFSSCNVVEDILEIRRGTSGEDQPNVGIGAGILFQNQDAQYFYQKSGRISSILEFSGIAGNPGAGMLFQTLSRWTGMTNALYLTSEGDVGIGTKNPDTKLEVDGTVSANAFIGDGSGLTGLPTDNLGNHTATQNLKLNNNWLSNDGGSEGLYITNAGKVGIDYQNPTSKLTIVDNDFSSYNVVEDILEIRRGTSGEDQPNVGIGAGILFQNQDAQYFYQKSGRISSILEFSGIAGNPGAGMLFQTLSRWTGMTNALYLTSEGDVGIGTKNPDTKLEVDGTVSANAFIGDGSGLTGILSNNYWQMSGDNIYNKNTGNVGIGSTNPETKLEVIGPAIGSAANIRTFGDIHIGYGNTHGGGIFFGLDGYSWYHGDYIKQTAVGRVDLVAGGVTSGTRLLVNNSYDGIQILNNEDAWLRIGADDDNSGGDDGTQNAYLQFTTDGGSESFDGLIWLENLSGDTKLHFDVEDQETMVMHDGKIGIGISNPITKLDVRSLTSTGGIRTSCVGGWSLHANSWGSDGVGVFAFSDAGTAVIGETPGVGVAKLASTAHNAAGYFNGNLYIEDGEVGIGTTSPATTFSNSSTLASDGTKSTEATGINWQMSGSGYALGIENLSGGGSGLLVDAGNNAGTGSTVAHFVSSDVSLMYIGENGNIGIGTTTPSQKLTVNNGSTTGTYTTSGWQHSSDARLKTNISQIDNALEKVMEMEGVYFDWKENSDNHQVGLIAQDLEKVLPEVVNLNNQGYYSVAYGGVVPVLIEAIKEQQKEIETLKEMIKEMDK